MHIEPLISFEKVSFGYDPDARPILHDLTFSLPNRSVTVIVGPSGGGKSTILALAAGLVRPTKGRVVNTTRTRMTFQNGGLLPWRTVLQNVLLGFTGLAEPRAQQEKRVHTELARLGIKQFANEYPRNLSGGQRQRVGLARALVSEPGLLLLDEPFSALDIETSEYLGEELLQIREQEDIGMLMVSHSIEDAVHLADEVLICANGTISERIAIPLPRPRLRTSPESILLVHTIRKSIPGFES